MGNASCHTEAEVAAVHEDFTPPKRVWAIFIFLLLFSSGRLRRCITAAAVTGQILLNGRITAAYAAVMVSEQGSGIRCRNRRAVVAGVAVDEVDVGINPCINRPGGGHNPDFLCTRPDLYPL